jgi:hypothetical protein
MKLGLGAAILVIVAIIYTLILATRLVIDVHALAVTSQKVNSGSQGVYA